MIPEEFIQRIKNQNYIDYQALLKALGDPSPVSIRINPSKWNKKPLDSAPVPWCGNGCYLNKRPSYTLDPLFHSGCYYPQEASGMFLEQAIRQSQVTMDGIRVLDLCGAPGGKSTLISDMFGPGSMLIANEVIRSRASILSETITKWGRSNTIVTGNDPSAFGRLPGYFDVIFVDAPCSGEGMFRTSIAVNEWSESNTAHCAERQKRILMDIWPGLKENGTLIYSTCTFNPGENEENISWLISKNEAECIRLDISEFQGITEIDFRGISGYGFYPDKVRGEGFFISVIRKTGKQERISFKNLKKPELIPGKNDISAAERWTSFQKDRLLRWGDELSAIPCELNEYVNLFRNLKIIKGGTKIGTTKKDDFLPAHELALSDHLKDDAFPFAEISLKQAIAYLRRDSFVVPGAVSQWNLIRYKDVNIGFIKNIGNRVNNYFPVEWRIRMNPPEEGNENLIDWDQ
jgi:16S rRNA C967 or C1407 C5-methylase (RsmB/RsmF family)/NOL1/NOP2/fmu family ribosome biogenesis protein